LKAKCPKCGNEAIIDEDMKKVDCSYCKFSSSYESYLEIMRGRAQNMSDHFQATLDKRGF
jgi:hypothetical protein